MSGYFSCIHCVNLLYNISEKARSLRYNSSLRKVVRCRPVCSSMEVWK